MTLSHSGYVTPSIAETAFSCPHCGALAKQFWYSTRAEKLDTDRVPISFTTDEANSFGEGTPDEETRKKFVEWAIKIASKTPFFEDKTTSTYSAPIYNLSMSECFNCHKYAVWLADKLIFPPYGLIVHPNVDMPEDVKSDYNEASTILSLSPRGAAALLRLAIQKLCAALGCEGKNLNDDIAALVVRGMDKRIQQALDVVRVVGNNAVHPGELNIKDDRPTAEKLFNLVNLITDVMISQPLHVEQLYSSLPEGARKAVEHRDKA